MLENERQFEDSWNAGTSTTGQQPYHDQQTYSQSYGPSDQPPVRQKKRGSRLGLIAVVAAVFGLCVGAGIWGMSRMAVNANQKDPAIVREAETPEAAAAGDEAGSAGTETKGSRSGRQVQAVQLSAREGQTVVTDVTEVVEKAMPAIVSVYNNYTQDINWFGSTYTQEGQATGSGIIIAQNEEELLIATNNHVVEGEDSLEVQFIDGTQVTAKIKGTDAGYDLAVISVALDELSDETMDAIAIAELGDSNALKIGEPAIAIGNALGLGQSVTAGVISAVNRELNDSTHTFIQTDAAINQGNSGGALLNINGQVIGINSNKLGGTAVEGMGYAIPISDAVPVIQKLANQATKEKLEAADQGTLGISGVSVTQDVAKSYNMPYGVYIARIIEGGAAENSDLQVGDIVSAVNGSTVRSMEELKEQLSYYRAGTEVEITVQRDAGGDNYEEKTFTVTLGSQDDLKGAETGGRQQQAMPDPFGGQGDGSDGWEVPGFQFHFGY